MVEQLLLLTALYEIAKYQTEKIQAAVIHVNIQPWSFDIASMYSRTRHKISIDEYKGFIRHFRSIFTIKESGMLRLGMEDMHEKRIKSKKSHQKFKLLSFFLQINPPISHLTKIRFQTY